MEAPLLDAAAALPRSVLVVDDSQVERMLATAVLQKLGWSVHCVASAEQALLLLGARRFDLAICDISLPGMDGLALLAALRALAAPPGCIMLSAHDDAARAQAALREGALAYLVKPLRPAMMRSTLEKLFPPPADVAPTGLAKLAALLRAGGDKPVFRRSVRPKAGAAARPARSGADALLPAGTRATG